MGKSIEQRVEVLEKQNEEMLKFIKQLQGKESIKLNKKLGVGDTFELAGLTWKILEVTEKGYKCLAERLEEEMKFDAHCNNWAASDLRNYLNTDFLKELIAVIGEDNIILFERDLLSLDGQTEYGKCEDKVSLLNVDEYRQYRDLLLNVDYWWWLITPWSTPCNGYESIEAVVCPSGIILNNVCDNFSGVRPFCIFSSAIFESGE